MLDKRVRKVTPTYEKTTNRNKSASGFGDFLFLF